MNNAISTAISVLESISAHTQASPDREQQETQNLIEQLSIIASQEHSLPLFTDPTIATILARTLKKHGDSACIKSHYPYLTHSLKPVTH